MPALPTEAYLQRRWAAAPPTWLTTSAGERWRVLFAGTWNHGAGPDFLDAILLGPGRGPLRGALEVHRQAKDWRRHGHEGDPAYQDVILQLVAGSVAPADRQRAEARPPEALWLGEGEAGDHTAPHLLCEGLVGRVGGERLERRMRQVARGRLRRKLRRLRRLVRSFEGDWDQAAVTLLLQELGRGGNGAVMAAVAQACPYRTLPPGPDPAALSETLIAAAERSAWMAARTGPMRPANRVEARLKAAGVLLTRWRAAGGPAAAIAALVERPEREALSALQVPRLLGRERARQLLVDVVYVVALAAQPAKQGRLVDAWLRLGGARYGRSDPLRRRLSADGLNGWRNGQTQALLEVERCYCRQGACAVCPLAGSGQGDLGWSAARCRVRTPIGTVRRAVASGGRPRKQPDPTC